MSIESLTDSLWQAAKEAYGRDCINVSIARSRNSGERSFWQAHICLLSHDSIFADGETVQDAHDKALTAISRTTKEYLAAVLGIEMVSA